MKHLVIGNGEVGKAIAKIFECQAIDSGEKAEKADILHICYPFNTGTFNKDTKAYVEEYNPKILIIHSTVPVGTTRLYGDIAVHSPIRGVHPNLEEGIRTFTKYIGYNNYDIGFKVCDIFKDFGLKFEAVEKSENTEAGKLLSTTYYGWNIMFEKYVHEYCKEQNLDFNIVYNSFNISYNKGYKDLDMNHVIRPVLKHMEGKIGGHCVIPNLEYLNSFKPARIIKLWEEE